jgi:hypothetical protein
MKEKKALELVMDAHRPRLASNTHDHAWLDVQINKGSNIEITNGGFVCRRIWQLPHRVKNIFFFRAQVSVSKPNISFMVEEWFAPSNGYLLF